MKLFELLRDEGAATMIEYGLIAALFALPMLAAMTLLATQAGNALVTTGSNLTNVGINPP